MRKNPELRKEMLERMKPVKGKMMLATFLFFVIALGVAFIPVCGDCIQEVYTTIFAIGLVATTVNLFNGKEEGAFSFFGHGIRLLKHYICCCLYLLLRCIVGIIIAAIGFGMVIYAEGLNVLLRYFESNDMPELSLCGIIGFLLVFIGFIVFTIQSLSYSTITYEIVHNDENKSPRGLMDLSKEHTKGHLWQWICMVFYFGIFMILFIFIAMFIIQFCQTLFIEGYSTVVVAGDLDNLDSLFAMSNVLGIVIHALIAIFMVLAYMIFLPKITCGLEMVYQDILADEKTSKPTETEN